MNKKELIAKLQKVYENSTLGDIPLIIKELEDMKFIEPQNEDTILTKEMIINSAIDLYGYRVNVLEYLSLKELMEYLEYEMEEIISYNKQGARK